MMSAEAKKFVKIGFGILLTILVCSWLIINYLSTAFRDMHDSFFEEEAANQCTVGTMISEGPNLVPAKPFFQGIESFSIYIDYGSNFEEDLKALTSIQEGGLQNCMLIYSDRGNFCNNIREKYREPFYPIEKFKTTIMKAIKIAYEECISDFNINFFESKSRALASDAKTLSIFVSLPDTSNASIYDPAYFIKLHRKDFVGQEYKKHYEEKTFSYKFIDRQGTRFRNFAQRLSGHFQHGRLHGKD